MTKSKVSYITLGIVIPALIIVSILLAVQSADKSKAEKNLRTSTALLDAERSASDEMRRTIESKDSRIDDLVTQVADLESGAQKQTAYIAEQTEKIWGMEDKLSHSEGVLRSMGIMVHDITDRIEGAEYTVGRISNNPDAKSVSYGEVVKFLNSSVIPDRTYSAEYDCTGFAADLYNEAESKGIDCGIATVSFEYPQYNVGHALNFFQTTDYGLVYVDAVPYADSDGVVRPAVTVNRVEVGSWLARVELRYISPNNIHNGSWWDYVTDVNRNGVGEALDVPWTTFEEVLPTYLVQAAYPYWEPHWTFTPVTVDSIDLYW